MSNSARLLCPWASPGKNTGVVCHSLLQGIFLTQGLNPGLLHCRWDSLPYREAPMLPSGILKSLGTFFCCAVQHVGSWFPNQELSSLPPALEAQSPSHWATMKVPLFELRNRMAKEHASHLFLFCLIISPLIDKM